MYLSLSSLPFSRLSPSLPLPLPQENKYFVGIDFVITITPMEIHAVN